MSNSPDTLQVLLIGLASESMILGLPDLAWSSRLLQAEGNFFNRLVTGLWSTALSPLMPQMFFGCFCVVMTQCELKKHKFQNQTTLHIYLCSFQITHGGKQCTTCQSTNYHNTTIHNWYLLQLELLRSRDIWAAN